MPRYLVELYLPRSRADGVRRVTARIRSAAERMRREGSAVRCLHSIFVPNDEILFEVFDGASAGVVEELHQRCGLAPDRIVEAVYSP
jgi:hypothetical protein